MWDLSFLTRDQTHTPCIRRRSLNNWTAKEVPRCVFLTRTKQTLWAGVISGEGLCPAEHCPGPITWTRSPESPSWAVASPQGHSRASCAACGLPLPGSGGEQVAMVTVDTRPWNFHGAILSTGPVYSCSLAVGLPLVPLKLGTET